MARIALIGPGAIGATVVVELMRAERHEVITCARSPVARLTLETSDGASSVAPKLLTAPNAGAPVDWVLVATKAYDVAGAAVWLESLIGPNAYLAVLQNGVEHVARFRRFAKRQLADRHVRIFKDAGLQHRLTLLLSDAAAPEPALLPTG